MRRVNIGRRSELSALCIHAAVQVMATTRWSWRKVRWLRQARCRALLCTRMRLCPPRTATCHAAVLLSVASLMHTVRCARHPTMQPCLHAIICPVIRIASTVAVAGGALAVRQAGVGLSLPRPRSRRLRCVLPLLRVLHHMGRQVMQWMLLLLLLPASTFGASGHSVRVHVPILERLPFIGFGPASAYCALARCVSLVLQAICRPEVVLLLELALLRGPSRPSGMRLRPLLWGLLLPWSTPSLTLFNSCCCISCSSRPEAIALAPRSRSPPSACRRAVDAIRNAAPRHRRSCRRTSVLLSRIRTMLPGNFGGTSMLARMASPSTKLPC